MTSEIVVSLIEGIALIISSVVTTFGLWVIIKYRKVLSRLTENIEFYYLLEEALIKKIIEDKSISPSALNYHKGKFRKSILGDESVNLLSKRDAMKIRKRYLG